jgi:3-oxoacyl-[acyl-carrier protein] reductase
MAGLPSDAALFRGEWLKEPEDVVPLALFLAAGPLPGPTAQSFSLMRRDG